MEEGIIIKILSYNPETKIFRVVYKEKDLDSIKEISLEDFYNNNFINTLSEIELNYIKKLFTKI